MKFSIIGTGFIFPAHTEAIRSVGGRVVDVVNTARSHYEWMPMIEATKADTIVILTPNDLHIPIAKHALAHGKQVLSEKPLGITSLSLEPLLGVQELYTVLQLRKHPLVEKIKIRAWNVITLNIEVYRDEKYFTGWKGQTERSGGVLFNLGVHYFDLLFHTFGFPLQKSIDVRDDKTVKGSLLGKNYECQFTISVAAPRNAQKRVFEINGESFNFSSQDNLSFENLHREVYKDLMQGEGIRVQDVYELTKVIESL